MPRAIFIHGMGGHPDEGWRPWLRNQCEERRWEVAIPAMPDTDHPQCRAWVDHLAKVIGKPDAETILVGHSLGCPTILRYLEQLPSGQTIRGVVLVASFFEDLGPRYSIIRSFVDRSVDWQAVRRACSQFAVIHSDDDTVVPVLFAKRTAEHLGCDLTLVHGMKHFSGDDGIIEAPVVLHAMERLL